MSTLVAPNVTASMSVHPSQRDEEVREAVVRRERVEVSRLRRQASREERARLIPKKEVSSHTRSFPSFAWIPFLGSLPYAKLIDEYKATEESGVSLISQAIGSVPTKRVRSNWSQALRDKVVDTLAPAYTEEEGFGRSKLMTMYDTVVSTWHAAFTSSSFDPNEGSNYELLEKIGDTSAKLGLQVEMIAIRPDISEHELTVAANTILAKQEQGRVSNVLGLPPYLRTIYPDVNTSESEDLFESFFGALFEMGELENSGQAMVNRFVWYLNSIDLIKLGESYETPPKTQVSNLFAMLGWGSPVEGSRRVGNGWNATVSLNSNVTHRASNQIVYVLDTYDAKEHIDKGTPYKPVAHQELLALMTGGIVGNGKGDNEARALYNAYSDAVANLKRIGLIRSDTLGEHYRVSQDFDRSYEQQFRAAYLKAKSQGYDNIFSTDSKIRYSKDTSTIYVNLLGIRLSPSGAATKEVIYTLAIPSLLVSGNKLSRDKSQIRRMLYERYAMDKSNRAITTMTIPEEDESEGSEDEEDNVEE